jgi:hypothetical protein
MRYTLAILLLSFSLFIGCRTSKPTYNQDRDIPEDPRFTVIPTSEVKSEREFASEVEEYIIKLGFRLMRRPGFKAVETNTQAAQKKQDEANTVGISASKTELYYSYQDTHADYVFETSAEKRGIKIVRTSTTEVLGLLELSTNVNYDTPTYQILEILEGIGFSPKSKRGGTATKEIQNDIHKTQATSRSAETAERRNMFESLLEPGYKEYTPPIKAKITFITGLTKEVYIFAEDTSSYMLGSSATTADFIKAKKENIKEVLKQ